MSRFASAPWPLKAAYIGGLGAMAATALTAITFGVALAGLHRLSAHLEPAAVLRWFWYFKADPQVRRWLRVGGLTAGLAGVFAAAGVVRSLRVSLYGEARWASESELKRASP
jgi:type IV secretion system protein VirD4